MSTVVLLQAQPRNAATGALVNVRLAGGGVKPYNQLGYGDWRSGIADVPRFTSAIGFDQTGWTGGALPQTAGVTFAPALKTTMSTLAALYWQGARIIITVGDDEAAAIAYTQALVGTVASATISGNSIVFTIADLSADLSKPIVPDTFAGTGDLEGPVDAVGRVKRRTWGQVFNVEGRILDTPNNVYEFGDPAQPLRSFLMVKDKGRAGATTVVGWAGSALATLNALRASTPPSGGATVAPSIACVKWWTVPSGPLTADMEGEVGPGYVATAADITTRLASLFSPDMGVVNAGQANGWQPSTCGVHCDSATETVGNVLDRLLLPIGIAWVCGGDGSLTFRRFAWDNPVASLIADTIVREATFQPLKTRRVGYQRNYRIQSDSEISSVLLSAVDATYADGTPIEVLKPAQAGADKTGINTAAALFGQGALATKDRAAWGFDLSNVPPAISYYDTSGRLFATNVGYDSATPISALRPAQANADRTAVNIASGFNGQGALATLSALSYGGPYLAGFAALAAQASILLGGLFLFRSDGSTKVTDASAITSLGTASAIAGQGAFATLNSAAYGSSLLSGFGALAPLGSVALGSTYIRRADGLTALTEAMAVTSLGIASAIAGQSDWATFNSVPAQTMANRTQNLDTSGNAPAYIIFSNTIRLSDVYPAQAGADKTSLQTAAGIAGQGALATQGAVNWRSQFTGAPAYVTDPYSDNGNNLLQAGYIYFGNGQDSGKNLFSYFPATTGSDKTGNATAAAITGQGQLATAGITLAPSGAIKAADIDNYGVGRLQDFWPAQAGADVTSGHTAAALQGQGALATRSSVLLNTTTIYRADGSTVVSETLIITGLGVAAAIAGQGSGATANNLAQLDPGAAKQLANTASAQTTVHAGIGNSSVITRAIPAGGQVGVAGAVRVTSQGGSGTVHLSLQVSSGGGGFNEIASDNEPVQSGEPALASAQGAFTNNTGATGVFDFRMVVTSPNNTSSDASASYFTA